MKKTLTINLGSIVFNIDDDAYDTLQSYLSQVSSHFKQENEKADIMSDIELRIAELFNEKMNNSKNVITIEDVEDVISVMGTPNEFSEQEELNNEKEKNDDSKSKSHRKLYRDSDNMLLGGVCSGIAAYIGWDSLLVRFLLILITIFTSGVPIAIYLLLWVLAPKAITTSQKMEMRGETVTIDSLNKKIEYEQNELGNKNSRNPFFEIISVILKIALILVIGTIGLFGIVLLIAFLLAAIILLLEPTNFLEMFPQADIIIDSISTGNLLTVIISIILLISIPIFVLIYWLNGMRNNKAAKRSNTTYWVALILWFAGLFMLLGSGKATISVKNKTNYYNDFSYFSIDDSTKRVNEIRAVNPFTKIETRGSVKIELTQSDTTLVSVTTVREIVKSIKTEVKNGVLKIDNLNTKGPVVIKISNKVFDNILASGATTITSNNTLEVNDMTIYLSGASKVNLKLKSTKTVNLTCSGASNVHIDGSAKTFKAKLSGASKLIAKDFLTENADITSSGATNAKIYASKKFTGDASGTSKIEYLGNPKLVSVKTSGLAKIN